MPTTNYIWDPVTDSYLMEADETGATTATYTVEPVRYGRVISQRRDEDGSYYHYDGLGSTRELTDDTETVVSTNLYDAWGVNRASTGPITDPFLYVGEVGYYFDTETKDNYVRARMYRPRIAQWTAKDPLIRILVMIPYKYSNNMPIVRIDRDGRLTVPLVAAAVTKCDAYSPLANASWRVHWKPTLNAPAPCDGYFVQHLLVEKRLKYCGTTGSRPCHAPASEADSDEVWEAFEVKAGSRFMDTPLQTDGWALKTSRWWSQCGRLSIIGRMEFHCRDDADDPRPSGQRTGTGDLEELWGHQYDASGVQPSTFERPDWWGKGYEVEEPLTEGRPGQPGRPSNRHTVFEFTCCAKCKSTKLTVIHDKGTTEYVPT